MLNVYLFYSTFGFKFALLCPDDFALVEREIHARKISRSPLAIIGFYAYDIGITGGWLEPNPNEIDCYASSSAYSGGSP